MCKKHRDISIESAQFKKTFTELIEDNKTDLQLTRTKYLDKIINIDGCITNFKNNRFTLNNIIVCYTDSRTLSKIKKV